MPPDFVVYSTPEEYREYYKSKYCRERIFTSDGIRVFFDADKFNHAFYGSSNNGNTKKDYFDQERAKRIDWIRSVIEHKDAVHYMGWHNKSGNEPDRRGSIVYDDYVVILSFRLDGKGDLKAKFVTAFFINPRSNTLNKIKSNPKWDRNKCVEFLKNKKNGR